MPSAAFRDALEQGKSMVPRMLVGILAASFLAEILPKETIGAWAGVESGWRGILLASLIGALAPTGPMVLFPVMIALMEAGVGLPQTVAFLTSWGMLAVHRVLVWELPMMGINFVIVRLAASVALVPLSGFLAGWIADWLHA
ncbi:MAG: hypothetical protein EXQ91_03405 [Alphaproteobacteria bacterium]|nr:hypothetical protein [Alphaproteobacteria bacterium]